MKNLLDLMESTENAIAEVRSGIELAKDKTRYADELRARIAE